MKIVQCWDDGVEDDVRLIEIFRKYGAKASFNLNAATHQDERHGWWSDRYQKHIRRLAKGELKEVYEGFLIANHTLSHPHLTQISPEDAFEEIRKGREALEEIFGYPITGFAYPYGDVNETVQELVRKAGHCYARTTVQAARVFPAENPMALPSHCHFLAPDFWEKFEGAKQEGIFYFWGHSYELVTDEQWNAFEETIARLSQEGEWAWLPELFPPCS